MKELKINIKDTKVPLLYEFDNSMPVVKLKLVFKNCGTLKNRAYCESRILEEIFGYGSLVKKDKFFLELETKAISLLAYSSLEYFAFEIDCIKEQFNFAFEMLTELINNPNFDSKILNEIKIQMQSEILSNKMDFDYVASTNLNSILHKDTNLGATDDDILNGLKLITIDDIKKFYEDNFMLSNLVIMLGGDIKDDLNFNDILNRFKIGQKYQIPYVKTSSSCNMIQIKEKNTQQAYIYFGAPFNIQKEELHYAIPAISILGSSGFGSRLLENIRVKHGLAYSIYVTHIYKLSNIKLTGYMQTKNENKDKAIELIKKEFKDFIENGVTKQEFKNTKNFILGSSVFLKETMFKRFDLRFQEFYLGLGLRAYDEIYQKISDLELKDLNSFIKRHSEILNLSFSLVSN